MYPGCCVRRDSLDETSFSQNNLSGSRIGTEVHFKSHDQLYQNPSFFHAYQSLLETVFKTFSETPLENLLEIHFSTTQNNVQRR